MGGPKKASLAIAAITVNNLSTASQLLY